MVALVALHGEFGEGVGERGWDEHGQESVDAGAAVGGFVLIGELGVFEDKNVTWVYGAAGEAGEEADDAREE